MFVAIISCSGRRAAGKHFTSDYVGVLVQAIAKITQGSKLIHAKAPTSIDGRSSFMQKLQIHIHTYIYV